MSDTPVIDLAGAEAESVAQAVKATRELDPAIAALENSLAAYLNGGGSVDDVVPGGDPDGLGFGRKSGTGWALWNRYVEVLRDEICTPSGELHQVLTAGIATSGAALVTSIIALLGISAAAAPVIAPIAGVMLALGVKAFCPPADKQQSES